MMATPRLETLVDAVVAAAPDLDGAQRAVALATFREVATGRPATVPAIAERSGADATLVAQLLDQWNGVFCDDAGAVVGFWGIAIPEMPHRLRIGDADLHAWCAWDPLFLVHIVGGLDVDTADPVTREPIHYHIDDGGAISQLSHPASVVSFLIPDGEWGPDVQATFCHFVLHFVDRSTAERWTASHPGTTVLTLDDAVEVGRAFARRVFGVGR